MAGRAAFKKGGADGKSALDRLTPFALLAIAISSIAAGEALVMLALHTYAINLPLWAEIALDVFLLSIVIVPVLHFFIYQPMNDSAGKLLAAEQKLKKQYDFLNYTLDSLQSPFYVIDASDYSVVLANMAAHGGSPYAGVKCHQLTHQSDIPCDQANEACPLHAVVETGEPVVVEHDHQDKNGISRTVEIRAWPIFNNGKVVQIIEHAIDITERKEAERRLRGSEKQVRLIMDTVPAHVAYIDKNRIYKFVNGTYSKWLLQEPEEIVGRHINDIVGKNAYKTIKTHVDKALSGEQAVFEAAISHKDDVMHIIQAKYVPHRDEKGDVLGFIAFIIDVTEEREKEEALKRYREQLVRSEKLASLGHLSAGVAHELKNPLNIISASIQLLQMEEGIPEETRQAYETVMEQVARSTRIIDNLRDFARERKPASVEIDLHGFLEKTIALVEYEMRVDSLDIVRDFEGVPVYIKGDPDQLAQVFLNIINNARDSMNEMKAAHSYEELESMGWEGMLTVATARKDGSVGVTFKDTGVGMTQETIDRLFDPFFSTKGEKGTGLGMSIAYGIIENHGGEMYVTSQPGQGSVFRITFPEIGSLDAGH